MSKWHKFAELTKVFLPLVVAVAKPELAPLTHHIVNAVNEAEQIPGASNTQKLQHVQETAKSVVELLNASGKTSIDVDTLDQQIDELVTMGIKVVKTVHPSVDVTVSNSEVK
jgi:hypothetical protein